MLHKGSKFDCITFTVGKENILVLKDLLVWGLGRANTADLSDKHMMPAVIKQRWVAPG